MSRPLRIEYDGALYHLTSRGNERKAIFKDDTDRQLFLSTLAQVVQRFHWLCHAYCLMDNHYHLVVETPDASLSKGMRQLNGVYTQAFNRRHRRVGHLFQGRFKGILIQKESHILEVCRYVVLNPVAAAMVKDPREWAWSSYRATSGQSPASGWLTVDEVLGQFSKRRSSAQKKYRQFVREGIGRPSIWENLEAQSLLGEEGFAEALTPGLHGSTFGGGPLTCAVALEFLATIEEEDLLENVRERGAQLRAGLSRLSAQFDFIREVRGEGLIVGAELAVEGRPYVATALKQGLLINCTQERVLRFLPAFIVSEKQVEDFLKRLAVVLGETKRPVAKTAANEADSPRALAASR